MTKTLNSLKVVGWFVILLTAMWACQNENEMGSSSAAYKAQVSLTSAQNNNQIMGVMQDVAGVTANAFASQGVMGGRLMSEGNDDGCKPTITNNIKLDATHTDSIIYSGTIVIDFGTGTCADSVAQRKGKIIDSLYLVIYHNDSVGFKSWENVTFVGYEKDSVTLDGSLSITAASGSPMVIKVNETKTKFKDGSSSTWKGDMVFTVNKTYLDKHYGVVSSVSVTGSWSGTMQSGESFSATITSPVIYKAACYGHRHRLIPVSGTIDVTTNGVASTIDYGTGTCDNAYTITTSGVTKDFKFG